MSTTMQSPGSSDVTAVRRRRRIVVTGVVIVAAAAGGHQHERCRQCRDCRAVWSSPSSSLRRHPVVLRHSSRNATIVVASGTDWAASPGASHPATSSSLVKSAASPSGAAVPGGTASTATTHIWRVGVDEVEREVVARVEQDLDVGDVGGRDVERSGACHHRRQRGATGQAGVVAAGQAPQPRPEVQVVAQRAGVDRRAARVAGDGVGERRQRQRLPIDAAERRPDAPERRLAAVLGPRARRRCRRCTPTRGAWCTPLPTPQTSRPSGGPGSAATTPAARWCSPPDRSVRSTSTIAGNGSIVTHSGAGSSRRGEPVERRAGRLDPNGELGVVGLDGLASGSQLVAHTSSVAAVGGAVVAKVLGPASASSSSRTVRRTTRAMTIRATATSTAPMRLAVTSARQLLQRLAHPLELEHEVVDVAGRRRRCRCSRR